MEEERDKVVTLDSNIMVTLQEDTGIPERHQRDATAMPSGHCTDKIQDDTIKMTPEMLNQMEEYIAASIVSTVLENVVNQLAFDERHANGNDSSRDEGKGFKGDSEINKGKADYGRGDHTRSTWLEGDSEPIYVPTDRDQGKVNKNYIHQHMGQRTKQSGESLTKIQGFSHGLTHDERNHPIDLSNSGLQMDVKSGLSAGVLEVQLPASQSAYYTQSLPVISRDAPFHAFTVHHHRNQMVSHSYPPPGKSPTTIQRNQQIESPSSSPTQRLLQFPNLRASSVKSGKDFLSSEQRGPSRSFQRHKFPPAVARMSTVMTHTRERTERQRMISMYYEERCPSKLMSLDQCINSRPPMAFDLDTPGPCRYTPADKPLHERNSPKYTFGYKFYERDGGGRTAWAKTWFNSTDNQTTKVNYEDRWPSPTNHASAKSLVGRKLPTKMTYPSFSIGVRSKFTINKRGSENEPSPNEYNPSKADGVLYSKSPSFSMTFRNKGTSLWSSSELTPAPDIYSPRVTYSSSKPHRPAFTIQGIRRPKSHALGPHATF